MNQIIIFICISFYFIQTAFGEDFTYPLVIGHRGASGYRPENTLHSWELSANMGVDFVETDLEVTKDHVLIVGHSNELSETTNIAERPEFSDRQTTKNVSGFELTGWFTEDFTLQEIKSLRSKERFPFRPQSFNGLPTVSTLEEYLQLVKAKEVETGRPLGLYIETKNPKYFRDLGLPMEEKLVHLLHQHGYNQSDSRVLLQSFETDNLKLLKQLTSLRLIQLIEGTDHIQYDTQRSFADLITPQGLTEISKYAYGIGPLKTLILPRTQVPSQSASVTEEESERVVDIKQQLLSSDIKFPEPTTLLDDAHKLNLKVHPWTFRAEQRYFDAVRFKDISEEIEFFFKLGVDGVFVDHPDKGVASKKKFLNIVDPNDCIPAIQEDSSSQESEKMHNRHPNLVSVIVASMAAVCVFVLMLAATMYIYFRRRYTYSLIQMS